MNRYIILKSEPLNTTIESPGPTGLEAELLLGPPDDGSVGGPLARGRPLVLPLRLPVLERHLALLHVAVRVVVFVVVHDRLGVATAREPTHVASRHHKLVALNVILVARLLRAHAEALPNVLM